MRHIFNLDREWRFRLGDETVVVNTHSHSYLSSKAGGVKGVPSVDYDDAGWRIVNIPHDYLTESDFNPDNLLSHGYKTRSNAWYRKSFRLPEELRGKHVLLSFEGTAVTAEVYLNGSLMGRSFSAYAPLDIDITDRAHFGDRVNTLAVHIDGLTTEGWWYEGAGIYRHVKLYVKELLHLKHDSIFIKPKLDENTDNCWDIMCEATVENSGYSAESCRIKTEIFDGDTLIASGVSDEAECEGDLTAKLTHSLRVLDPERWDVDSPKLYIAKVSLIRGDEVIDSEEHNIGFRTFTVDVDKGFFLNGNPIKLKGTCNHQDHAGVGVAVPDSIQYYRIKRLKELGTNAYRCSHNMPAKEILDACDRLGLLVMDENRRFECRPEVLGHVESMVRRDRNHPCVVMYSLFNEEPIQSTTEGQQIYKRMKNCVLRLDDSRIITGAMNGGLFGPDSTARCTDAAGCNYGIPENAIKFREMHPTEVVFGAENNSAVTTRGCYKTDKSKNVLACYDEETVPWGQLIKDTWRFTRENDWFGGIFIWTGFDYRGEPTPFTWPSISSQFGIMDTCGFPKDSFYQNKICFVDEPLMHITPHWNWNEGDTVRVMPATNCEEVELFLNGRSLGRKKSDPCELANWYVPFEAGTLKAVGYINGIAAAEDTAVTAGAPARIVIEPDRSYILNDGADAVPINFSVVDAAGNTVENASNLLHFEIVGDGVLLGVGNGDPNCHESDHLPMRSLFAGHAQAIVQTLPNAKSLCFKVSGEGLEGAEFNFKIREAELPEYIYLSSGQSIDSFTVTSEVFAVEPDPLMEIADNDMNSLVSIHFNGTEIKPGHTEGYRFFRAYFYVPSSASENSELVIKRICAELVRVYIDGICLCESHSINSELIIPCSLTSGNHELRILVQADGKSPCGILGGVELKGK